jgi:hypothetical protein
MDFVMLDYDINLSHKIKDTVQKCTNELNKNIYEMGKFYIKENKNLEYENKLIEIKNTLLNTNNYITVNIDSYVFHNTNSLVSNFDNIIKDLQYEINKYYDDDELTIFIHPLKNNSHELYYLVIENKYLCEASQQKFESQFEEFEVINDSDTESNLGNDETESGENLELLEQNSSLENKKELQDSLVFILTSTLVSSFIFSQIGLLSTGTLEGMAIGNSIGIIKGFIIGTAIELLI